MSLQDKLAVDAFGDGTGNGGKALTGLAALISATATVGGLSPTTYPWWKPHSNTSVGSWAGGGLNALRTAVNTLTYGTRKPDVMFTTQDVFEYIEAAEEEKIRYRSGESLDIGFTNVLFKGIPVFFDRDCTSGVIYLINSKHMSFEVHKEADMKISPFITTIQQDITSAKVLFQGNVVVNNRRMHGILSGITA